MGVLEGYEPLSLFRFFEELTQIPRISHHEKAVSDYLVAFAHDRNLEVHQDAMNNVIIIKGATAGRENDEPIILQAHMDIVGVKQDGCTKDMLTEGADLAVDGDEIHAVGTTLGADDGAGVALALALLDEADLSCPRIEFVCTTVEEDGMSGAAALDITPLQGHRMINLDSEEEGVGTVACAGGVQMDFRLPVKREKGCPKARIVVSGLCGGHSGMEINNGHPNAIRLITRVLADVLQADRAMRLVTLSAGNRINAIPDRAEALVELSSFSSVQDVIAYERNRMQGEYANTEPNLSVSINALDEGEQAELRPLTMKSTRLVLALLETLPDGVQAMEERASDTVKTSLNLGLCRLEESGLTGSTLVRSSVATELDDLVEEITWIGQSLGADVFVSNRYPAWEWAGLSTLRSAVADAYREQYGRDMTFTSVHAGLECGLFADKIPNFDAVSIGPDMAGTHTPAERLNISSFARTYELLKHIVSA